MPNIGNLKEERFVLAPTLQSAGPRQDSTGKELGAEELLKT